MKKKTVKKPAKKAKKLSGLDLQLLLVKDKFEQLKKIQAQLGKLKTLYSKHDELMAELLPLFITTEVDKFTIRREIIIGAQKYKLNPHFYDTKKGQVQANVWKSTAFKTATIE